MADPEWVRMPDFFGAPPIVPWTGIVDLLVPTLVPVGRSMTAAEATSYLVQARRAEEAMPVFRTFDPAMLLSVDPPTIAPAAPPITAADFEQEIESGLVRAFEAFVANPWSTCRKMKPKSPEKREQHHHYRLGDRVVAVKGYAANNKIIGCKGTVMAVVKSHAANWVGIVYDKNVVGHCGDPTWFRLVCHGRGWNTGVSSLKYLGWRVNPKTWDVDSAEVK